MSMEGYELLPDGLGRTNGNIYDEYPIYKMNIPSTILDSYFPDKLPAFNRITCKNLSKRYLFYSKPSVFVIRAQVSHHIEPLYNLISINDLLKRILSENDSEIRYNFVILDDCLIFMEIPRIHRVLHYLFSKHLTLSNRAKHVRYAGQMWCDEDDQILINNNSGTYRPSNQSIEQVIRFFNYLAPDLQFQGISFCISSQLSMRRQITKKIKKKLTIKNN